MNNAALVLIDLQKESKFGIEGMDTVLSNTEKVIKACRKFDIPIIYTRQINRHDGKGLSKNEPLTENGTPLYYDSKKENIEILDVIKPAENDIVIDKYRWSAFHETSLDLMLKNMGIEHVLIGGVVTDGCLMTSVFDAYFRDYTIHLIHDICAATNEGAHMASLLTIANWVYNLSVYDTENFIKWLNGNDYAKWETKTADSLQFTPENMRDMYTKLTECKGE